MAINLEILEIGENFVQPAEIGHPKTAKTLLFGGFAP